MNIKEMRAANAKLTSGKRETPVANAAGVVAGLATPAVAVGTMSTVGGVAGGAAVMKTLAVAGAVVGGGAVAGIAVVGVASWVVGLLVRNKLRGK